MVAQSSQCGASWRGAGSSCTYEDGRGNNGFCTACAVLKSGPTVSGYLIVPSDFTCVWTAYNDQVTTCDGRYLAPSTTEGCGDMPLCIATHGTCATSLPPGCYADWLDCSTSQSSTWPSGYNGFFCNVVGIETGTLAEHCVNDFGNAGSVCTCNGPEQWYQCLFQSPPGYTAYAQGSGVSNCGSGSCGVSESCSGCHQSCS
jgi:hypothetical protein